MNQEMWRLTLIFLPPGRILRIVIISLGRLTGWRDALARDFFRAFIGLLWDRDVSRVDNGHLVVEHYLR